MACSERAAQHVYCTRVHVCIQRTRACVCGACQMATDVFPFEASNLPQLALKIAAGSYPALPPAYSPALHHLVASMLQVATRTRSQ